MKSTSCNYLQKAIYLGPDELRHCCQRFYVDGQLEGDVPIFQVQSPTDVNWLSIAEAKENLIHQINQGEKTGCWQCPHLEEKEWPSVKTEKLDIISIEHHSHCNMRCSYCSDVYYGGKNPSYDIFGFLNELIKKNKIAKNLLVAWGGGEPTMFKDFSKLIGFINSRLKPLSQRFFSNAINYDESIAELIASGTASLITSIDAGSKDTFRKVRGVNQYAKVLRNLKKYFALSPDNIVIKYIFTEENYALEELSSFASDIKNAGLSKANFLLSSNFRSENLSVIQALSIIHLHILLLENGAHTCTFDEHVRPRIKEIAEKSIDFPSEMNIPEEYSHITKKLRENTESNIEEIIVWGAGSYAHNILNHTVAFKNAKISYFVDSSPMKQNIPFRGLNVFPPEKLYETDTPILIGASFYYHEIYNQLVEMGIDQKRVLPNFLI